MVFTTHFLVGDRLLSIIIDLLCLIKLILCFPDLCVSIFLSSFALCLSVSTKIYSIFMFSQVIKQNL